MQGLQPMNVSLSSARRALKARRAPVAVRWLRDDRGTSMITTVVTLPLLLVIMLGIFWLGVFMYARWMLRQGANDAAQHISEQGRFWNIDPSQSDDLLPEDWYDTEAYRVIANRLREVMPYSLEQISSTLTVTVTEPAIATDPTKDICVPGDRQLGEYRTFDETRFMVQARWAVPVVAVRLPFDIAGWNRSLVYHERTIGHLQCPRWTGKGAAEDLSKTYGAKGPSLPYSDAPPPLATRAPVTVTPLPAPTETDIPTETPTVSPTP
jgi:hypothetical protein